MKETALQTVKSTDGTLIAYQRSGEGPPLVLVHGTAADHSRWNPILSKLEERFSIYAMNRRGRGASGDFTDYTVEREFGDVAALIDAVGEPVFLLGHSFGALCSLEAALLTPNVRKLVLYEPPVSVDTRLAPPALVARLDGMVAQGDREGVLTTFFREFLRLAPAELEMLQGLPTWAGRIAAAHTIPRELRFDDSYEWEPHRFTALQTPTLLLVGGESAPYFTRATETVRQALPASQVVVMPGQQHTAMNTAPELFLREVFAFLA